MRVWQIRQPVCENSAGFRISSGISFREQFRDPFQGGTQIMKHLSAVLLCLLVLTLSGLAKSAPKKSAIPAAPDKAYLDLYPFEKDQAGTWSVDRQHGDGD
jgi:hypothetical protein